MWKDDLDINFEDCIVSYDRENINLIGTININVKDIDDFYKSFQVKKTDRKKIKKMKFDFNYDLNQRDVKFSNIKINEL